jgi:hypothetical protein
VANAQGKSRSAKAQKQPEGKQVMSVLNAEEALNKARVLGTVEGVITRFIESKDTGKRWGFELAETIKAQSGASWERNWTVWSQDADLTLDSHVIVTGDVSFKYEEYDGLDGTKKAKVVPNINNPHIKPAFVQSKPAEEMPF